MKKKLFGLLTAILTLGVLGGTAFAAAGNNLQKTDVALADNQPSKLYLKTSNQWSDANPRYAAYFFGNGETWVSMTKTDEDKVYEVTTPTTTVYPSVIFCRMNPGAAENNWNNKWNQTGDLTIPTDGTNMYTVKEGTWDKGGGSWSGFRVPSLNAGEDIEMYVGATSKLEPTVNYVDSPTYTYSSDNEECVSVDSEGNINALAAGNATITVNETTNNLTDTIAVTVKSLDGTRIIYLENGWYSNYFYAWDSNGNNTWPGKKMDYDATNNRHYIILDSDYTWTNCIFNDNSGHQTADLTMPKISDENETYDKTTGKWVDRMYEGVQTFYIDFDKWSGEEAVPAIAFKSIFAEKLVLGEKVDGSTIYEFTSPSSMNSYSLILARLSESTPSWDVRLNQSYTIFASDSPDTNCFISTGFDSKNLIADLHSLTYTTSKLTYSNVEAWANLINNQCTGASVTQEEMNATVWSKAKTTYNTLTEAEKILVNTALADENGSELQHALATYFHLVTEREFEDFANRVDDALESNLLKVMTNNSSFVIIIACFVGLLTVCGLVIYRKKRIN